MPLHSAALLLALFVAAGFGSGCSLGVSPPSSPDDEGAPLPALLELESPHEGLIYSYADDELPASPGIDLLVRVLVRDLENDVWLSDVAVGMQNGMPLDRVPVHEDWRGRRCAELPVTLFPGGDVERAVLVASAGELGVVIERDIFVGAALSH